MTGWQEVRIVMPGSVMFALFTPQRKNDAVGDGGSWGNLP